MAKSSTKAEYYAMASATAEFTWIGYLLCDIGVPLLNPPRLFCDNLNALHLTVNPVFHSRTKHIQLDYHFVREKVAQGSLVMVMFLPLVNLQIFLPNLYHVLQFLFEVQTWSQ